MNLHAIGVGVVACAMTGSAWAGEFIMLDQIGAPDGSDLAQSASSSQFSPDDPHSGGATVDNFFVANPDTGGSQPLRLTKVEAVVTGLPGFLGYKGVTAWTVQIYSSLNAAATNTQGDVASLWFDGPASFEPGFFDVHGPSALVSFDIDLILDPGEYYLGVVMQNQPGNGSVGIQHSTLGDGGSWIAIGGGFAQLGGSGSYRITATTDVPAPATGLLLLMAGVGIARRRR